MKILICGGRDYFKYSVVKNKLEDVFNNIWNENDEEVITIIHGAAQGADTLAKILVVDEWADSDQVFEEAYPADWKTYGKSAGAIRNQKMLDEGKPDLVIAFPGGNGTKDMVTKAKNAGIELIEVND